MYKAKYIIVIERGHEVPIIFHPLMSHVDMAQGHKVVSAGFCDIVGRKPSDTNLDTIEVWVDGRSVTLKDEKNNYVVSRPEDSDIIKRMLMMA